MKVYIVSDLEGVACVFSRREGYINAMEYGTMELVAICEKLLANGVDEILINCFHIMEYHKFPKQVRFFHSEPTHDFFTPGLEEGFDVAMITGMHAMSGGVDKGNWRHTILPPPLSRAYSSIVEMRINGNPVGETAIIAMFAGLHHVPVVFFSGEHWACKEAKELIPGLEIVETKKGLSFYSAISRHPLAVAEESAEKALKALKLKDSIKPVITEGPVTIEVQYTFAQRATDAMATIKNAVRIDETTISVTYKDMQDLKDHFGCMRAPEDELHQKDLGFEQVTGFMTRTGVEPYSPSPTSLYPGQVDFALTGWGNK